MRRIALLWLYTLASCISDPTVACGDHRCPSGFVCTPTSCATPEAVDVCAGKADHDPCTTSDIASGACGEGACHAITCGDLIVDPPEACDDGNLLGGDGCSPSCNSTEVCGNGVVDLIRGETCDEGAGLSQDGCSSRCQIETAKWRDVTPTLIAPHRAMGMAYDTDRREVVMFGGYNATTLLGDTWEYDIVFWTRRDPPRSPQPRAFPAMVYDAKRHEVVMFGGIGGTGNLSDTWTWDGTTWTQIVGPGPSARASAAMVYDAATESVILFGGVNSSDLNDTWEWNGAWTERHPANSPGPREGHTLAYDSFRARVVLVGGGVAVGPAPFNYQDMWEWNGTDWTDTGVSVAPRAKDGAMIYNPDDRTLVFYGGEDDSLQYLMWVWDGTTWTGSNPTGPALRSLHRMIWDDFHRRLIMFGGQVGTTVVAETWWLDASGWLQLPNFLQAPAARFVPAATFDTRRGRGIVVGGVDGNTSYQDAWMWQDHRWTPIGSNPGLVFSSIAYDSDRDRSVLFGGTSVTTAAITDETWELDAGTWTKRAPLVSPPVRNASAMAYDRKRRRIVLYGGENNGVPLTDTWEWDGTIWTKPATPISPPARARTAMAYDEHRERTVMFGGEATTRLNDIWEWDGVTWTQKHPALSPPVRANAMMIYDANRERIVIFGGLDSLYYDDIWEWDGTTWTRRLVLPGPSIRAAGAMMYDSIRHEIIEFGGIGLDIGPQRDVWVLRYDDLSTQDETCIDASADDDGDGLVGCADPDCWGRCSPTCPPSSSCASDESHCGDGVCGDVEDAQICPTDCP